jgi:hypothetical protein
MPCLLCACGFRRYLRRLAKKEMVEAKSRRSAGFQRWANLFPPRSATRPRNLSIRPKPLFSRL